MRKIFLLSAFFAFAVACHRPATKTSLPTIEQIIRVEEVTRIETILASDDMQGRKSGTPGIEKAAAFIAAEFAATGLQTLPGLSNYRQEFHLVQPRHLSTAAVVNGRTLTDNEVVVITQQPNIAINEQSGFETVHIRAGDQIFAEVRKHVSSGKNLLVVIDTAHRRNFGRLSGLRRPSFPGNATQVFILSQEAPVSYQVASTHTITEMPLANIVGVLPGKSRPGEYVIFSAHYDHLGIGKPNAAGDSIYNGANDDAAGTTAVMMLARYFKALNNNERTLIFVAFTAEEIGGYGSQYFSRQLNPDHVMAMFNIEMIGTESKWGTNAAYITGFEKSNMGTMMQENLAGSGFQFHPDPYPDQQLFYRSDNATLAALGVPAHTISTAKMDKEPYYHSVEDEIGTLDLANMTAIIRAIAISSSGIVSGRQTPDRVKP